ncbi:hypothetical protein BGZ94_007036 [Podila epigama]|nr:hypothetical protein BGZ94_007036 [Podila epigama]
MLSPKLLLSRSLKGEKIWRHLHNTSARIPDIPLPSIQRHELHAVLRKQAPRLRKVVDSKQWYGSRAPSSHDICKNSLPTTPCVSEVETQWPSFIGIAATSFILVGMTGLLTKNKLVPWRTIRHGAVVFLEALRMTDLQATTLAPIPARIINRGSVATLRMITAATVIISGIETIYEQIFARNSQIHHRFTTVRGGETYQLCKQEVQETKPSLAASPALLGPNFGQPNVVSPASQLSKVHSIRSDCRLSPTLTRQQKMNYPFVNTVPEFFDFRLQICDSSGQKDYLIPNLQVSTEGFRTILQKFMAHLNFAAITIPLAQYTTADIRETMCEKDAATAAGNFGRLMFIPAYTDFNGDDAVLNPWDMIYAVQIAMFYNQSVVDVRLRGFTGSETDFGKLVQSGCGLTRKHALEH